MRKREKMLLDLSPSFKKTFSDTLVRTKLKPFPVLVCPPEEAMSKVKELVESGDDIDIVFFDLPGTVNNRGVVTVANCMDMIVVPISADKVVLESSLAYALKLQEWLTTGKSQLKGVHMLWNMVDAREKTELYERYEKLFDELGLPTMSTKVPDTKKYRREGSETLERAVFRSTIMPPDKALLKGTRLQELAEEFLKVVNL
ncbi:putative uncharacterized protein [Prevotella sp. CAG:1031]|nr:putative uncharacterized protein [Prevotella sp. CAG:1031]